MYPALRAWHTCHQKSFGHSNCRDYHRLIGRRFKRMGQNDGYGKLLIVLVSCCIPYILRCLCLIASSDCQYTIHTYTSALRTILDLIDTSDVEYFPTAIVGAGCAGLTLCHELINSKDFPCILLDPQKFRPEHAFSFWDDGHPHLTLARSLARKTWSKWEIRTFENPKI